MAYENEKIEESMFEFECELDKALTYYSGELALVKAGRANPKILDKITIDYYETPTPINQIAGISVPEARMIVISPWDHTQLKPIVKAIQASDIGITPMDDGKVIRLIFPALTEERRREIAKSTHKLAEDAKITARNARRDAMEIFKKLKKDGEISEDMLPVLEKDVQGKLDSFTAEVDKLLANKEREIMQI